ncbi:unnamed protein product [Cylindrotheca closterium]|uniref:Uncharacterized protein n=1 Tax=Cylindrotheca closterium TaxID=2856 RepID=A0AAD2CIC7_9STRA|nr:unnamed protein product [Cylindrotheca closterium]CAJ1945458.1 unnamed protein product [Cylindrotheca closterium]CAJ1966158.1 unnamed protein product [Cylindrotheca closterium]
MPNTRAQRKRSAAGLRNRNITVLGVGETRGVSLQIFISGDPIAQPRPRFAVTRASRTYIYNPAARAKTFFSRKMKQELQETGLASTANPIFTLPGVEVQVQFGLADMSKDLDNMLKFILDVLEDAGVYANDRLVRKIVAEKVQSNTGFTSLSVSYMDLATALAAVHI